MERWLLQPDVLRGFDWKVVHITAKDWHHAPKDILELLERALADA
jgi:hypothetical protein